MVQIDKFELDIALDGTNTLGNIDVQAVLKGTDFSNKFLWARIEYKDGREADTIFPLLLESRLDFCMQVEHPILWNAENAAYYKVIVEIRDENAVVLDRMQKLIGFYRWSIMNDDVCLNGKPVSYRTRYMPRLKTENAIVQSLRQMKREYINTLYLTPDQKNDFLSQKALEYGFYLVSSGEHLDCGRICGELDRNPKGFQSDTNPDFSIQVVKDGALIENRSTFINTDTYQLRFKVQKGVDVIQKGMIHVDVPAGESRYLNIPFLKPQDAGNFTYYVSLCLEAGAGWEEEGYEIVSGKTNVSNFYSL